MSIQIKYDTAYKATDVWCDCPPCKTCGYKHYCNVNVPHHGGWVRVGTCPPTRIR